MHPPVKECLLARTRGQLSFPCSLLVARRLCTDWGSAIWFLEELGILLLKAGGWLFSGLAHLLLEIGILLPGI